HHCNQSLSIRPHTTRPRTRAGLPCTTLFRSVVGVPWRPYWNSPRCACRSSADHGGQRHEGAAWIRESCRLPRLDRSLPHSRRPEIEEHTSELQSPDHLVCRRLIEKKKLIKSR